MSYFDQRGPAQHSYLDTSQPLMPFPSSVTGATAGFGSYGPPPGGTGSYGPPPGGIGSYGPPPGGTGSYGPPPGYGAYGPGFGEYTPISNQYRGFATFEPVGSLGVDMSTVPIAPSGTALKSKVVSSMPGLYAPPGVKLIVDDLDALKTIAQYQAGTYTPKDNRFCILTPTPGGMPMQDIVMSWAKAGLFVVIINADPLCSGPSLCGMTATQLKAMIGAPGWSVFVLPNKGESTKENWDKWLAGGPPPVNPITPVITPLVAGISNGALAIGAIVVIGGIWMLTKKPAMAANRGRHRRRLRRHSRRHGRR